MMSLRLALVSVEDNSRVGCVNAHGDSKVRRLCRYLRSPTSEQVLWSLVASCSEGSKSRPGFSSSLGKRLPLTMSRH